MDAVVDHVVDFMMCSVPLGAEEIAKAAYDGALKAGASRDQAAEITGEAAGALVLARGGDKEEAGRAAGDVCSEGSGRVCGGTCIIAVL